MCPECGVGACRVTWYTPDFFLGFVIEAKGRFTPEDRRKALAMVEQHPEIDFRMLFEYDNKLSKSSKIRYTDWCRSKGIKAAVGKVPKEWLNERRGK